MGPEGEKAALLFSLAGASAPDPKRLMRSAFRPGFLEARGMAGEREAEKLKKRDLKCEKLGSEERTSTTNACMDGEKANTIRGRDPCRV